MNRRLDYHTRRADVIESHVKRHGIDLDEDLARFGLRNVKLAGHQAVDTIELKTE